jgi:hypothetical protein
MCPACPWVAGGARAERWKFSRSPSSAPRDARPCHPPRLAAARSRYLLDLLAQVPDPRKRRGRRHPLAGLLAAGISAVIAGSRSFAAIGQWAADAGQEALPGLGADPGPGGGSTFRRAFALFSPDVLDQVPGAWLHTRAVQAGGRLIIAVGEKAARGAKGKDGKAPHLVAAGAKSNEIPRWRTSSTGPRRRLPGRQVPGQDRKRSPRHGHAAPGHQPPPPRRPPQHRRRQPPPRPRPPADPQATSSRMNATLPCPQVPLKMVALSLL